MHRGKLSIPHYVGIMLIISPGFEEMYLNNWVILVLGNKAHYNE